MRAFQLLPSRPDRAIALVLGAFAALTATTPVPGSPEDQGGFHLPEDPEYTILDSARDSARFTVEKTLARCDRGHLASISSFVNEEAEVQGWHDFGPLEGPGWAANSVGGAHEIYILAPWVGKREEWQDTSLAILDHVLEHGFIDEHTGFITGYRHIPSDRLVLNFKATREWFCPGSMAKVAFQLLRFAERLPTTDSRRSRMRRIAVRCAAWIKDHVEPVPNGWYPRRTTPGGKVYRRSCTGGNEPFWQTSADGLFIVQLLVELSRQGLADHRETVAQKIEVFIGRGGIFGSINHDTYDPHESVAYAVAFRTLLAASDLLWDRDARRFAYEVCLAGLDQFKMSEDRNGVATRGLLYMEKSWDTAYLWENAEAALAYFEAARDCADRPADRARFERYGLTILRAIARHHHGEHGFLTEGVDWNNHVHERHHIDGAFFGDIRYTEPFLNNQHIIEPTVYYLENLARRVAHGTTVRHLDLEGNLLHEEVTRR